MKKKVIISMIFMSLSLSSCFNTKNEVIEAKKELGIIEQTKVEIDKNNNSLDNLEKNSIDDLKSKINEGGIDEVSEQGIDDTNIDIVQKEKTPIFEIKYLGDNKVIKFDELSEENLAELEVEITGKTLFDVDKIVVDFSNTSSVFPDDTYTLKKFKSKDENFLYRAFGKYETLDYGVNKYIFTVYSGDKISKVELIINNIKEEKKTISIVENNLELKGGFKSNTIDSNVGFDFPSNEMFGTPIDLGNGKISYTDISGLEIIKESNPDLSCEELTSFLADKINGWFFWNTCRDIKKDKGISYFIVSLDGEEYVYEKHYYLSEKLIYGIQDLERGKGVTSQNISSKNSELKEKNSDYGILKITDKLFIEISK